MEITLKDFMQLQPNYPEVTETDKYYAIIAQRLAKVWDNSRLLANLPEEMKKSVILSVTGYFQDIIADAGIWRSFSTLCYKLYDRPIPFYERPDNYVDSELNLIDVQFIIWYIIETATDVHGRISPFEPVIEALARKFFAVLDAAYDDAPTPTEFNLMMDVDMDDEGDRQHLYDLSYWLFFNSYFMRPAAFPTMQQAMLEAHDIISRHPDKEEARPLLAELNRRMMVENPTGPLSLTIGEWVEMIVNQKEPDFTEPSEDTDSPHHFYSALVEATGGEPIAFFGTYEELESFMSKEMGWGEKGGPHLPQMKDFKNFVVLGNPVKGILIAHDVAQYISHPHNGCYDRESAIAHGHRLVTEHGAAPIDLVKYVFRHHLVPDLRLPYDRTGHILHDHWDFLARLYQQGYYRGD